MYEGSCRPIDKTREFWSFGESLVRGREGSGGMTRTSASAFVTHRGPGSGSDAMCGASG